MSLRAEFLPPAQLPADVAQFWRERVRQQDPGNVLTRSPEWFAMMTGGRAESGAAAVVRSADGAPLLIAPLLFRPWSLRFAVGSRNLAGRDLAMAKVCGGDLIDDGPSPEAIGCLLDAVVQKCPQLDGLWLDHVLSSERLEQIHAAARRRFFVHPLFRDTPHYRLRIPATEEEFKQIRSPESLKKIQGRERALARAVGTEVQMVELRRASEWAPYEERLVELMNRTWQARLLGHGFSMDELRGAEGEGWLRVFLLLAGEQMVAAAICYEGMDTLVYEKIGYDQAFAKHSPGTLLLYRILDKARTDGLQFVDFGEGEADYKRQLANLTLHVGSCLLVRKSATLRALFAMNAGWRGALGIANSVAKRTGWKKRMKAGAK